MITKIENGFIVKAYMKPRSARPFEVTAKNGLYYVINKNEMSIETFYASESEATEKANELNDSYEKRDGRPGEYKPTEVDYRKQNADILLRACMGGYIEIWLNNPNVVISGKRGVKKYSERAYAVTDRVLEKLKKNYTVECDF